MDILLLNDTTFAPYLGPEHRVLSAGPKALYVMPEQDRFDFWLEGALEQSLDHVLTLCRERYSDFNPAVIIQFETGQNYFYRGIESSPALTVWRLIDTHMFYHWQPRYAQLFDVSLVAQKDYLPLFADYTAHAWWLPLNSNRTVHYDRGLTRDIPVSFVGSMNPVVHPARVRFLSALKEKVPLSLFSGKSQAEIADIYNHSQIVINECLHKDLNYRLFEALSNGAVCVTPRIDAGQPDLFIDGEDIVEYEDKDVNDAAKKIQSLLDAPLRMEQIRISGRDKVSSLHDIRHRVEAVMEGLEPLRVNRPVRRVTARQRLELVSLLAEFTFVLKKTSGGHMHDLLLQARADDAVLTARTLTALSHKFLERGERNAAQYCLNQAVECKIQDRSLQEVWRVMLAKLEQT